MRLAVLALLIAAAPARDRVPAASADGPAVDCVNLSQIRETRVRDGRTIDFVLRGGRVYRNVLPSACPELGFEQRFAYDTRTSQLCAVDTITVLRTGGAQRGATCGLGRFQPVTLTRR